MAFLPARKTPGRHLCGGDFQQFLRDVHIRREIEGRGRGGAGALGLVARPANFEIQLAGRAGRRVVGIQDAAS
jgi:hypothetical protein